MARTKQTAKKDDSYQQGGKKAPAAKTTRTEDADERPKTPERRKTAVQATEPAAPKTRRARPGQKARRDIKKATGDGSVKPVMRRSPLKRMIKEAVTNTIRPKSDMRYSKGALDAVQQSMETYLYEILSDSGVLVKQDKRKTLTARDIDLILRIRAGTGSTTL